MENPAQFDLNDAVARWRKEFASSPAFRRENLDELEAHLRDSMSALQTGGLNLEEAFLIASRRLGPRRELEPEFAKINSPSLWIERSYWMVAGILFFFFVSGLSSVVTVSINRFILSLPVNAHWIGLLLVALDWALLAIGIAIVYRVVERRFTFGTRVVKFSVRTPILAGIGMMLVFYSFPYLRDWIGAQRASEPIPGIEQMGRILNAWMGWSSLVEVIAWMAGLVFLACLAARQRHHDVLPAHRTSLEQVPVPLRSLVLGLQAQGLSPEEAGIIAERRPGNGQGISFERERPDISSDSIERSLWMVAGVVLYYLTVDMRLIFENLLANSVHSWPNVGPLLGFLSVFLGWAAVAAFVFALWQFVTRYGTQRDQIARLCLRRPLLAVLGLVLIFFCYEGFLRLLANWVPLHPSTGEGWFFDATLRWRYNASRFLHYLVPVVLLLWLVRRRWRFEEAR